MKNQKDRPVTWTGFILRPVRIQRALVWLYSGLPAHLLVAAKKAQSILFVLHSPRTMKLPWDFDPPSLWQAENCSVPCRSSPVLHGMVFGRILLDQGHGKARVAPQHDINWTLPTDSQGSGECPQQSTHTRLKSQHGADGAHRRWFCSSLFHFQLSLSPIPYPVAYPSVLSYTGQSMKISHIHSFNTGGYTIKWKLRQVNMNQMNFFLSFQILSSLASPVLSPQTSWIPIIFRYCASR